MIGELTRSSALAQDLHNALAGGCVTARSTAHRLSKGAVDDVNLASGSSVLICPATGLSEEARRMSFIYPHPKKKGRSSVGTTTEQKGRRMASWNPPTNTIASYSLASCTISFSGAMWPSMENTPSVAISRNPIGVELRSFDEAREGQKKKST